LTPSSLDYDDMQLDDLVVCDLDGNVLEGHRGPTTERALHLSALRVHDDIHATMHCHAKSCQMFAVIALRAPAHICQYFTATRSPARASQGPGMRSSSC